MPNRSRLTPWRLSTLILFLFLLAGAGFAVAWHLSWTLGVEDDRRAAAALAHDINAAILAESRKTARSLAAHAAVRETALGLRAPDNPEVMPVLETGRFLLRAAIVYVMNISGDTVACTPYGQGETLTGKNYAFRPYFRQPIALGGESVYAALGVTTLERGLYFSAVIKNPESGTAAGVVVVKVGLEEIDSVLTARAAPAALLSDTGIVFAANRPGWIFKSALPLSEEKRQALRETRQFADMPLEPLGIDLGAGIVLVDHEKLLAAHAPVQIPGWQAVELRPLPGLDILLAILFAGGAVLLGFLGAAAVHFFVANRRSLAALRAERDRTKQYLDVAGVLFIALDGAGRVILANPKACLLLGWPREELLGRDWFENCVPGAEREAERALFQRLRAGDIARTEFHRGGVRSRSGQTLLIEWHHALLRDERGRITGVLGSGEDITDRARLQEQIHQADKMRSIGQLAGGVAHDFNNQLAILMGYAELLRDELTGRPDLVEYARTIAKVVRRSADLTGQLLAFAHKGKYQSVPVDIHKIVAEVTGLLGRSIDKRIRLRQHLDANPCVTQGDPTQLQNAILNIALNARDAMPEGGELLIATDIAQLNEAYCHSSGFELSPGPYIQISVTDSGGGMDAETRRRIFEPFFTTKEKGTGMGMAAVYGTLRMHKGAVNVYSEVGHGTTIRLYLPIREGEGKGDEDFDRPAALVRGSGHILLVDDEEKVREMAANVLRHLGYTVTACADGAEGVNRYRELWRTVDLVLLDMVMPELGGRDTFLAMKQIHPAVKAILVSGYSLNGEAQAILQEGVCAFVQKPFQLGPLSQTIAAVLREDSEPPPARG